MKTLAQISGVLAMLLMIAGFISFFVNGKFLGVNHSVNFFFVANSFLLLTICGNLYRKFSTE